MQRPKNLLDVGFYPSGEWDIARLDELPLTAESLVVDLGCGDGRVLAEIKRIFGCRVRGYELIPEIVAKAREAIGADNVVEGNMWEADLSEADLVYVFWDDRLMEALRDDVMPELKTGTWVISHRFGIPQLADDQTIGSLHCYKIL